MYAKTALKHFVKGMVMIKTASIENKNWTYTHTADTWSCLLNDWPRQAAHHNVRTFRLSHWHNQRFFFQAGDTEPR